MHISTYSDYRDFLKDLLQSRTASNPMYSLRAFARDLSLSPQMISSVLNRKKSLSIDSAALLAERIGLNSWEASRFIDLVTLNHSHTGAAKRILSIRLSHNASQSDSAFHNIELDTFQAIADWHHYAILELSCTQGEHYDARSISKRLEINEYECKTAIDRLIRLKLLKREGTKLVKTHSHISASSQQPSTALRKFSRQILQKAIDSLDTQTIDERDITSVTMAIDPSLLPKAKSLIAKFRRRLCHALEQGNRTEVYVFCPTLFRLTKPHERKTQ